MKAVEASAPTREQAIQNALEELGVEMYQVDKIEILDEGSRGLFGFGARPVKVKVVVENLPDEPRRKTPRPQDAPRERVAETRDDRPRAGRPQQPPRQDRPERDGRPERPGRPERQDRPPRPGRAEQTRQQQPQQPQQNRTRDEAPARERPAERGRERANERGGARSPERAPDRPNARGNDRGRGVERGNDRGRERTPERAKERGNEPERDRNAEGAPAPSSEHTEPSRGPGRQRPPRPERDNRPRRPPREDRPPRPHPPEEGDVAVADMTEADAVAAQETRRNDEESFAPITNEQGQQAAGILHEIIARMGIQAQVAFERHEDGSSRVNVSSEDSAILIGRKGRTLGSLQYLVNRMISDAETENTERLVVDVEGYVDRRQTSLEEMARNLAQKAKDTQRNMRLKPLSPQERRIIHLTLQDDPDVRTFSIGESLFRSVIISPKNARPERNRPSRGRGGRGGRNRRGPSHEGEVDAGQFGD